MILYQTKDWVRLLPGGGPVITIPEEVAGVQPPRFFVANLAFMLAGQNDPCFTAMTAEGIRYVGWAIATEERKVERMVYVDAQSGASLHMSVALDTPSRSVKNLVVETVNSLPLQYRLLMYGRLEVEVSPMNEGAVIAFV